MRARPCLCSNEGARRILDMSAVEPVQRLLKRIVREGAPKKKARGLRARGAASACVGGTPVLCDHAASTDALAGWCTSGLPGAARRVHLRTTWFVGSFRAWPF